MNNYEMCFNVLFALQQSNFFHIFGSSLIIYIFSFVFKQQISIPSSNKN